LRDPDEDVREIIIVKRRSSSHDDHHGGVWKIAFADFMTAMMAFFLVLWIVNATSKETQSSIARYFNPIKISDTTPAPRGLRNGKDTDFDASLDENTKEVSKNTKAEAPPLDGKQDSARVTASAPGAALGTATEGSNAPSSGGVADFGGHSISEIEAEFRVSPERALNRIWLIAKKMSEAESIGNPSANEYERGAAQYADPFAGKRADDDAKLDEAVDVLKPRRLDAKTTPGVAVNSQAIPSDPLRFELGRRMASDPMLRSIAEPMFEAKNGSTSISIVDSDVVSLFAVGSAIPTPKAVALINAIGSILVNKKNKIIIQGHTDSRPFRSDHHDNWRLSTERALVTYQILRRAGLAENRFLRVEGYADRSLRIVDNPNSAENLRIQISLVE